MKILILGFAKLKYMPYINFYLNNIDSHRNEVHILYWNRDLKDEDKLGTQYMYHEFQKNQEDDIFKLKKVESFLEYRKYALDLLKKNVFDKVIVLHSLPGILLHSYLIKNYKQRYIFDFRDLTYERNFLFKRIIGKLVQNSAATFVSSDGFREYLPKLDKIYTSHNILIESLDHRIIKSEKERRNLPIRIAFWGFIRHEELNRKIVEKIAKDNRFELHYYGREQKVALNLKKYVQEISAQNVFFHGEYKPEDRYEFVKNTDIIHNIYDDFNMKLAMANKYYDGIIFHLPQLCMPNSFMGDMVTTKGLGLVCSPYEDDFINKIYSYVNELDLHQLHSNCKFELERVMFEYKLGVQIINAKSQIF
ncbi:hypothetical protein [Scatolibacter rhodanostii]|uniref:hypothetical protein n=1 Tax=Scatolibacter rhodanostii TaxID=2014781 RepID=UPI000C0713A8|nr:hypothetical protein [Scatolibacter rhodanostii]